MFDLYLKIIKTFAIFFLPVILFVLFKRSIIIFTVFLLTGAFKIVLRSCCSCLFREGQNSRYVPSVWLKHNYCNTVSYCRRLPLKFANVQ